MDLRAEHPRPQFKRADWMTLNGEWQFSFDDDRRSLKEGWFKPGRKLERSIKVPFCFEAKLSGIGDTSPHEVVFYKRCFTLPEHWAGKRVWIHFGAVDYRCRVYLNGIYIGGHEGGQTPFMLEITDSLILDAENEVSVWVQDELMDMQQPRGKQYWKEKSEGIYYTRTTGIWQSVWLEAVPTASLRSLRCTPDPANMRLLLEGETDNVAAGQAELTAEVTQEGERFCRQHTVLQGNRFSMTLDLKRPCDVAHFDNPLLWTPDHPVLFDLRLELTQNGESDVVESYFGLRSVAWQNGNVMINGRPCFLRLVLDQGYWPDGVMTAPSDESFKQDILLAKSMGFNGCRKHQKVEDPRFLYWADRLGFFVWGEAGSTQDFGEDAVVRQMAEWPEIIARDYNHPCIIGWVPLNESWGVPNINCSEKQQQFSVALYHIIHTLDNTRFVVTNDGWQMTRSDICAVHHYGHGKKEETKKRIDFERVMSDGRALLAASPAYREIFVDGYRYEGQPILLTEFGGIQFAPDSQNGWGYSKVSSAGEFVEQLESLFDCLYRSPYLAGFCYTQLTDVEQEQNGLLDADRNPKAGVDEICAQVCRWKPHNVQWLDS